jgi:hypothetical protein
MKGPWIFGRAIDLGVFLGPTLFAFALIFAVRALGLRTSPFPDWAWIALVLSIDVAHVWATLFRTYLDPLELKKRPVLYAALPIGCWCAGALLYARSARLFWSALAYLAVFHFIRQQIGWAAIYRARAGTTTRVDRVVDESAIYLSTLTPLLVWHTSLPRAFHWFLEGDFLALSALAPLVPIAKSALALSLLVFAAHHALAARRGRPVPIGKLVVVATTALSWWAGIVVFDDDFAFTVLNVLPHGVPYLALLFVYARSRAKVAPKIPASRLVALGLAPFLATLIALAFGEELLWDRLVFRDRDWLFGFANLSVDERALMFVVPLLAVPQATHYALDAFLWRRRDTTREQAESLGFRTAEG